MLVCYCVAIENTLLDFHLLKLLTATGKLSRQIPLFTRLLQTRQVFLCMAPLSFPKSPWFPEVLEESIFSGTECLEQ